jgi:hypothetical protein
MSDMFAYITHCTMELTFYPSAGTAAPGSHAPAKTPPKPRRTPRQVILHKKKKKTLPEDAPY